MIIELSRPCPVCGHNDVKPYEVIQSYAYFECNSCVSLYIDPHVLDLIDAGQSLVTYNEGYWTEELQAARDRSYGSSLARVAEALLYARRDANVFLDVGSGPGYLLDACSTYMPASAHHFYGVEKFPPPGATTTNPNFIVGSAGDVKLMVDAGCCIEVIEHLTPRMISELLAELSRISAPDALYIFNSGLPHFVKLECPTYLDPTGRGHIISFSVEGFDVLARPHGFRASPLPGKSWAFVLEKTDKVANAISDRIWSPTSHNRLILSDPAMGSVMFILGLESARAYS